MSPKKRPVSYHCYLQLDHILESQLPPDPAAADPKTTRPLIHHDELLFIITHQTMELWMKMILADLTSARDRMTPRGENNEVAETEIPEVARLLDRCAKTLEHLGHQFALIETMPPTNFLRFRDQLAPASGFQSFQFREIEIVAGLDADKRIEFQGRPYDSHLDANRREQVKRREAEPSLRDTLFAWLARTPFDRAFPGFGERFLETYDAYIDEQCAIQRANPNLSEEQHAITEKRVESGKKDARDFFESGDEVTNRAHQAFVFIASYRNEPLLAWPYALLERVLEFEEHFRLFRFRHARMVERMIGLRVGTGGSSGVSYLDATAAQYRIFGDLLKATSYLVDRARLPEIPQPQWLGFAIDEN
ncbi:MAG: tryptophan 2,3-dioxygenase family protein [Planctomycetota bacterium]